MILLAVTLPALSITVALFAVLFTFLIYLSKKKLDNWVISYLQNFVGLFFIVSGAVKAVDPLGTSYKMQDYFVEFESTFSHTWFSFIAPMFPWLSAHAVGISIGMIILEIMLGVMLITGSSRKLTAWAFLILIIVFTFMTGYTYLTGYVPEGVNFFQFSQWGPYVETNMKVTDCGCFGDFMKLKPFTTFSKDVILLIPGFLFLFFTKKMHQLFTRPKRMGLNLVVFGGVLWLCLSSFVWDIPAFDFRPFKVGVNIREGKEAEEAADAAVKVTGYRLINKETGAVTELAYKEYLSRAKEFPKAEYKFEQIKTKSALAHTKLSEFEAESQEGEDVGPEILEDTSYNFLVIGYRMYGTPSQQPVVKYDTIYRMDSVLVADTIQMQPVIDKIDKHQEMETVYQWEDDYLAHWKGTVLPVVHAAMDEGVHVRAMVGADWEQVASFKAASGARFPFYFADDIMLKTIVRSNPGVVLLKDGLIIQKWHYKQLPHYEEIKNEYMK